MVILWQKVNLNWEGVLAQRLKAGWNVKDAFEKEINKSKWNNKRKAKENNG